MNNKDPLKVWRRSLGAVFFPTQKELKARAPLSREARCERYLSNKLRRNLDIKDGADSVGEIFSLVEVLKSYINKLKQITYKDFKIRAIAESYYMDGLSIKEIVEILISLKVLSREDEKLDDLTDSHFKKVSRFVQDFKKHDVFVADKK